MNKIKLISIFVLTFSMSAISEGAFTTVMVSAKNTDAYIESVKSNTALYEAIGADAAGYCETISGRDYKGQLMMWSAFSDVTSALQGASKYDPSKAPKEMSKMRKFKYGATWAPIKPFPRLDPGYERAMRIKVSRANLPKLVQVVTRLEKEVQAAGHDTFMNGLFVAIGGGATEAGTYYLKSITSNVDTHGALIDDYFAGASWGNTYREALLLVDDVVNDQFEVCEQFYTASK